MDAYRDRTQAEQDTRIRAGTKRDVTERFLASIAQEQELRRAAGDRRLDVLRPGTAGQHRRGEQRALQGEDLPGGLARLRVGMAEVAEELAEQLDAGAAGGVAHQPQCGD